MREFKKHAKFLTWRMTLHSPPSKMGHPPPPDKSMLAPRGTGFAQRNGNSRVAKSEHGRVTISCESVQHCSSWGRVLDYTGEMTHFTWRGVCVDHEKRVTPNWISAATLRVQGGGTCRHSFEQKTAEYISSIFTVFSCPELF